MNKKIIIARNQRKTRVRSKLKSKSGLPRLVITRSLNHISAQVVDSKGCILAAATSKDQSFKNKTKTDQAIEVGKIMAAQLKKKKITSVVIDRGRCKYHGRIKALSETVTDKLAKGRSKGQTQDISSASGRSKAKVSPEVRSGNINKK